MFPSLLLLSFLRFSLQKQSNRITTRPFILARRHNEHTFARAGGFIAAAAGPYIFYADSSFALLAWCSSQALEEMRHIKREVQRVSAMSSHGLAQRCSPSHSPIPNQPWSIHRAPCLHTPCRMCYRVNGTYTSFCQIPPSNKVLISLGGVVTNNY